MPIKYKKVVGEEFLPNDKVKKYAFDIPSNVKKASLQIIAQQLSAPTNEKIFNVSAVENGKKYFGQMLCVTPQPSPIDFWDKLLNYDLTSNVGVASFFRTYTIEISPNTKKVQGTIYTKEPTGSSLVQILLKYEIE